MNKDEFKKLYSKFKPTRAFSAAEWDAALSTWEPYYSLIVSPDGLPLDRWLKNEKDGYLPDYLDTKEQKFGHPRIGNYNQVMIYRYTGSDKKKKDKYINCYKDKKVCFDDISMFVN